MQLFIYIPSSDLEWRAERGIEQSGVSTVYMLRIGAAAVMTAIN
jgi:hypothetical protein